MEKRTEIHVGLDDHKDSTALLLPNRVEHLH